MTKAKPPAIGKGVLGGTPVVMHKSRTIDTRHNAAAVTSSGHIPTPTTVAPPFPRYFR